MCFLTPPLAPPPTPPLVPPPTPPLVPPPTPPLQNDVSSSVLSDAQQRGGTIDSSDDPQFFPMTFVKARVSCEIPKQSNADLPHTFNRMSEFTHRCSVWPGVGEPVCALKVHPCNSKCMHCGTRDSQWGSYWWPCHMTSRVHW